jgi:pimeloyl-ACP methyl ester carboxylesterase
MPSRPILPPQLVLLLKTSAGLALFALLMQLASGQQDGALKTKFPTTVVGGRLTDTTRYTIAKPDSWNGTLFVDLDSNAMNSDASNWLYAHGIAVAGDTRDQIGSLVNRAADNLVETIDIFTKRFGAPKRAIASGTSLGGQVAAVAALKYPSRFVAALPHCGGLMGWGPYLNTKLDVAFVLKTLVDPMSNLPLVHIPEENGPIASRWQDLIERAQKTPEGRARISLAVTLGQGPTWTSKTEPEPNANDPVGREKAAYATLLDFSREFTALRRRLEVPAGGATSWNDGIDYRALFQKTNTTARRTVEALYKTAGLSLDADFQTLQKAPRLAPEHGPIDFVKKLYPFDGKIAIPILGMNNTGDPYVWSAIDSAYVAAVRKAGREDLLRLTYVHGSGHCGFTDAERIATYEVLLERLDTGNWPDTSPTAMNARAAAANNGAARFWDYKPPDILRGALTP